MTSKNITNTKTIVLQPDDPRVGERATDGSLIRRPKVDINHQPYTKGQRPELAIGQYFVVLPLLGLPETDVVIEEPKAAVEPKRFGKKEAVTDEPGNA